jgi:hypothetical protein
MEGFGIKVEIVEQLELPDTTQRIFIISQYGPRRINMIQVGLNLRRIVSPG